MPLRYRQRIARICMLLMSFGWGFASASVAMVQEAPDLTRLPWVQILVGSAISSWGGATATLGRYLAAEYEQRPFLWRLELVRDAVVSITVGGGAYLAGAWYGLGPLQLGLVLLMSGYLGVRLLAAAASKLLSMVSNP